MRQSAGIELATFFLSAVAFSVMGQTCNIVTYPGYADTEFDVIFTQNGPCIGLKPKGSLGWTGGDSTCARD